MRRAAKVDGNHVVVVEALRNAGASVQSLAAIGKGCPDLLVGYGSKNILVEVKMPKGKLTTDQETWFSSWRGGRPVVVYSAQQALEILQAFPSFGR